ncbi:unnamed protein product [Polarella glacialis]|uniref:WW domain-containing protein n=2 Tax=Polarella glacialis TaxID=89957 RepID=A0A813K2T5_POLGL|nr:unnamed protein product [Polarella glacialis]CAE8691148.1 unnamed protein product [Polarella glacialis]
MTMSEESAPLFVDPIKEVPESCSSRNGRKPLLERPGSEEVSQRISRILDIVKGPSKTVAQGPSKGKEGRGGREHKAQSDSPDTDAKGKGWVDKLKAFGQKGSPTTKGGSKGKAGGGKGASAADEAKGKRRGRGKSKSIDEDEDEEEFEYERSEDEYFEDWRGREVRGKDRGKEKGKDNAKAAAQGKGQEERYEEEKRQEPLGDVGQAAAADIDRAKLNPDAPAFIPSFEAPPPAAGFSDPSWMYADTAMQYGGYWESAAAPVEIIHGGSVFPEVFQGPREGEFIGLQSIAEMGEWVVFREKKPRALPFFWNIMTGEKTWDAPEILKEIGVDEVLAKWSSDMGETGIEPVAEALYPEPYGNRRRRRPEPREPRYPQQPPSSALSLMEPPIGSGGSTSSGCGRPSPLQEQASARKGAPPGFAFPSAASAEAADSWQEEDGSSLKGGGRDSSFFRGGGRDPVNNHINNHSNKINNNTNNNGFEGDFKDFGDYTDVTGFKVTGFSKKNKSLNRATKPKWLPKVPSSDPGDKAPPGFAFPSTEAATPFPAQHAGGAMEVHSECW